MARLLLVVGASFSLAACFSPRFGDGQFECAPACPPGLTCGPDGLCHAGPPDDATARPDAAADATRADAGESVPDAGPDSDLDAGLSVNCPTSAPGTLSLYPFEGGSATDVQGGRNGVIVETVTSVPGPAGCGEALRFGMSGTPYIEIPDAPAWDLTAGSVEFWLLAGTAESTSTRGLVSRDANGTQKPGHITIALDRDADVFVRLQDPNGFSRVCSEAPISETTWTHVGVNFGPPATELYIDGVLQGTTGNVSSAFDNGNCDLTGGPDAIGIAGNDNPWVLGASAHSSDEDAATPLAERAYGTAIDHLRVSSQRQDFGARVFE